MVKTVTYTLILLLCAGLAVGGQDKSSFDKQTIKERMIQVANWQLAHPNHELYQWHNAAFFAGIFAAYETTGSKDLLSAMIDMGEKNQWKPGPRFDHADDIAIGQTYIDLYRIKNDHKMIQP